MVVSLGEREGATVAEEKAEAEKVVAEEKVEAEKVEVVTEEEVEEKEEEVDWATLQT